MRKNFKNLTQEKLNNELKHDRLADKELNNSIQPIPVADIMENIETVRKKRLNELKKSNGLTASAGRYTQAHVAKAAGISLSTYHNYQDGTSNKLGVTALLDIIRVLNCRVEDIIKPASIENEAD